MDIVDEKEVTLSQNLKVGDEFEIGEIRVHIDAIRTNNHGDKVFDLTIIGATTKKRSKMMLILPTMIPITTLK